MILINREMKADEKAKTANHNLDEYLPHCQASFNSDGNITLRNYDGANKEKDQIIILSETETNALFALFNEIGRKCKNNTFPF